MLEITLIPIAITALAILLGLLLQGIDRKLVAEMQSRVGPPVTQPFRDLQKLMKKETITPKKSVSWLFKTAPIIALIATSAALFYIPLGSPALLAAHGDLILVLYLLAVPSLAMVFGGMAAGSTYSTIGAQREMVMMMSYEMPLAITFLAYALVTNTFQLTLANSIWIASPLSLVGVFIMLIVLLIIVPAGAITIPFDAPEAETEIAGGLLAEYSGKLLAFFQMGTSLRKIVIGSVAVALFFPFTLGVHWALELLFFFLKVFVFILISVSFVRAAFARLKIDQSSGVYLAFTTLLSLIGLLLIFVDKTVIA